MARDFKEFVEEVSARASIVRIASDYTRLKKQGSRYVGLCPFHEEKTPSFTITPEKNLYYCFGCGAGGNIFHIIMQIENVEFRDAVRLVAERSGIPVPDFKYDKKRKPGEADILFDINEIAASWFFQNLMNHETAFIYLKERGILESTIRTYRLGYAPDTWDELKKHILKRNFDQALLKKCGLFLTGKDGEFYDMFRGRIMFPIHDYNGRISGFGGRTLTDDNIKYLNTPETPIFNKSRNLFGLHFADKAIRQENTVVIVEGYFDQIALWQADIKNSVAPLGTAFNKQGAGILKRYTDRAIIAYDSDDAGKKAALRTLIPLLTNGFEVKFLVIPGEKDPDDFVKHRGQEEMRKAVSNATNMFDYLVNNITADKQKDNPREIARAVDEMLMYLDYVIDPAEREILTRKLADHLHLSEEMILQKAKKIKSSSKPVTQERTSVMKVEIPLDEKKLIRILSDGEIFFKDLLLELLEINTVLKISESIIKISLELDNGGEAITPVNISGRLDSEEMEKEYSRIMIEDFEYRDKAEREFLECINSIKRRKLKRMQDECYRKLKDDNIRENDREIEEILKKIHDLACQIQKLS